MPVEMRATYRLQLSHRMGFQKAARLVDYLSRLGVSHLYLSPLLQAGPGSEHGYDVADPTQVNLELGGEEDLQLLFRKLDEAGMAAVIDLVPNHLAAIYENPWWRDVLKRGEASRFAHVFDIRWDQNTGPGRGRILLPVLEDHLAKVLEAGQITLENDDAGEAVLCYGKRKFPINAEGAALIDQGLTDPGAILDRQHYRLSHWGLGPEEINYRRFFNVADLAGVRVEDPKVFEATHRKLIELARSGPVDGLRIDHPDGLRDPADYFHRLRRTFPKLWLVVEKILEPGEPLPREWPVQGTTGYDFLQLAGGLWIDPTGEKAITDFYGDFTGQQIAYGALVREQKRRIIESAFEGDLMELVRLLRTICDGHKLDYPRSTLRSLLIEMLSSFPVYRSYVRPARKEISDADRRSIGEALSATRRRQEPFEEDLLGLLEDLLTGRQCTFPEELEFVARFQQMTGPVMAKGVEDTAFYRYDRLLALNEVGCDPARFGVSPGAFHEHNVEAQAHWPERMLSTSTHDTKRSEDVRCRISLLSEIGAAWADEVRRWAQHNFPAWAGREPDRSAEHLFYQTLVGAWPIEKQRMKDYMKKAYREAGRHTSWTSPDMVYENRMEEFIDTVLNDAGFISMLELFTNPLILPGYINSLGQTLLKLTSPGVPDIYQGCELWDNSLVDPDNRREVDFSIREEALDVLGRTDGPESILKGMDKGLPKMHVIREALALRKRRPDAFRGGESGAYRPLPATGRRLGHLVGFFRGEEVAVAVPRLLIGLDSQWEDTQVAFGPGLWRNVLDGRSWDGGAGVADLFSRFPVALLERIKSK